MEVVIHMPPSIHQQHMFSISRKSFVSIPRYPRLRSVKHGFYGLLKAASDGLKAASYGLKEASDDLKAASYDLKP